MFTLRRRLDAVVDSFWLVPAVLLGVAAILAEVIVGLDRSFVGQGIAELPFVNAVGPSGSRDLLAAIGGSMLGVAATSFSITISVIATASSTYGPRLVRNFMADRGNQIVLGTFGATFLYALLVLRTVREESASSAEFVPHLAVTLAIALAVVDVAVLIYFIHHIADSIQVATLASQVLRDLQRSLSRDELPDLTVDAGEGPTSAPVLQVITAETHGFLRHIDYAGLVEVASAAGAVIQLVPRIGDHVIAGDTLVEVMADRVGDPHGLDTRVRRQLDFGRSRTPHQDTRYAVQQLAEMAVRAMSTGINDPYTAINAIVELGTGLSMVVDRPDPAGHYGRDGEVNLVVRPVAVPELVDLAFDQIRTFAVSSTEVVLALLDLSRLLGERTQRPDVAAGLNRQVAALHRQFLATTPDERDRSRVEAALPAF